MIVCVGPHVYLFTFEILRRQQAGDSRSHSHGPHTRIFIRGRTVAVGLEELIAVVHWAAVVAVEAHVWKLL